MDGRGFYQFSHVYNAGLQTSVKESLKKCLQALAIYKGKQHK